MRTTDQLTAARAEALFASPLSARTTPSPSEAAAAIRDALHRYGGSRGCAEQVAQEFGDHAELAAARMRWALAVADGLRSRGTASRALYLRHDACDAA